MATTTLFIAPDFLKQTTVIEQNIDAKIVTEAIIEAQDLYILPLLGTALYDRVIDEIDSVVSANIKTLLDDHIQRTLKWYVLDELTDFLTFRYVNKAVMKKSSENSTAIETVDAVRMSALMRNKAEIYADRMKDFLCEERVAYPEYHNPGSRADTIRPKRQVYETSIFLGERDTVPGNIIDRLENNFNE